MFQKWIKKSFALLLSLTLALSMIVPSVFAEEGPVREDADTQRFVSFNLRYDTTSHDLMKLDVRGPHLLEVIQKYHPDSIGFQEATDDWMNYLRTAMDEIGYAYVGVGRDTGTDDPDRSSTSNEFNPVFYQKDKYDLMESGTFWLSKTPDEVSGTEWGAACPRICTYVVLKDKQTGQYYGHFNTHLDHVALSSQANEVRIILNRVKEISEKYDDMGCVVTGDFNSVRFDNTNPDYIPLTYNIMTSRMDDSRSIAENILVDGGTFNGYQKPIDWENGHPSDNDKPAVDTSSSPIDYLFLTKGAFDVKTYTVIDDTFTFDYNGVTYHNHPVSDHYGVFCEVQRKEQPGDSSMDESAIIDYPAETYVGGKELSKEDLENIVGALSLPNVAADSSVSSNIQCASNKPVSNVLDTTSTAQVGDYDSNVYWEITLALQKLTDIQAVTYTTSTTTANIPSNVEILVSNDNSTWKKVGGTILEKAASNSTTYVILDEPAEARYVKMVMPDTYHDTSVKNISVYGVEDNKSTISADRYTPISGPKAGEKEGYEMMFDDNVGTKFYVKETSSIVFRLDKPETALAYSFTSGNDNEKYPGRYPSDWVLYGSSTGEDGSWQIIDRQSDVSFADVNYAEFMFDIQSPTPYQYYKIDFTKLPNGNMQFSEFDLYKEGNGEEGPDVELIKMDQSSMSPISGPKPGEAEGYENLFDGDVNTKLYYKNSLPDPIIWKTDSAVAVPQYSFTTANDSAQFPGRMPSKWTLYGSATGEDGSWQIIDDQTGYNMPDVNSTEFTFEVKNPVAYQYYKLQFNALGTQDRLQLSEVSLYQQQSRADYSKVDEALNAIPEDLSPYTRESLKVLADVLGTVDRTKSAEDQNLVNQMAADIQKAVEGLEAVADIPVSSVTIQNAPQKMKEGESAVLGCQILPENASNKNVTWSSSDEDILTVGQDGTVQAVGTGKAVITVTSQWDLSIQDSCEIEVSKKADIITDKEGYDSNEEITVTFETDLNVTGISLRNELGRSLGLIRIHSRIEGDHKVWSVKTCIATTGNRTISVFAKADGQYSEIGQFKVTIGQPMTGPAEIYRAEIQSDTAQVGEDFLVKVTTNQNATKLSVRNERWKAISFVVESVEDEGDNRIFTIRMNVGTAGLRLFSFMAAGDDNVWNGDSVEDSILIS